MSRQWWNHPWVVALGSGLFFLVLAAAVADLSIGVLVLGAVGMVCVAGIALLAAREVTRRRARWRDVFRRIESLESDALRSDHEREELRVRLSRVALFDVLREAHRQGWQLDANETGLVCIAPDGARAHLPFDEINWYSATTILHGASPEHWDEMWVPPVVGNGLTAMERIAEVQQRVGKLEARTDPRRTEALVRFAKQHQVPGKYDFEP